MSAVLFKKAKIKVLTAAILGMFAGGAVPGVFLDANDWGPTGTGGTGVVFQDLSGTPVTAMEQPVQVILDKSKGLALGTALTISSWTNFSSIPYETFTSSGSTITSAINTVTSGYGYTSKINMVSGLWYLATVNLTLNSGLAPQISTGDNGASNNLGSMLNRQLVAGQNKLYFLYNGDGNDYLWLYSSGAANFSLTITVQPIAGNHAYVSASANRPVITARYNQLLATAVLSTQSVTVTAGSWTLYFTGSGSVALSGAATGTKTAGSNVITCTSGTLTLTVTGSVLTADLRPSGQATGLIPTYQRVDTATDYDWSPAFPPMIKGNGSNQFLQTAAIDFTGTNKMTVWAGVRKTSDASGVLLFEHGSNSGTVAGTFGVFAPSTPATHDYYLQSRGATTAQGVSNATATAPCTNVFTGLSDISAPSVNVQVNGVSGTANTASQGGGNYTAQPFYIFSRAGTSLFMNGGFNSLIVLGAAASAAQISMAEAWVNSKVRAYA